MDIVLLSDVSWPKISAFYELCYNLLLLQSFCLFEIQLLSRSSCWEELLWLLILLILLELIYALLLDLLEAIVTTTDDIYIDDGSETFKRGDGVFVYTGGENN